MKPEEQHDSTRQGEEQTKDTDEQTVEHYDPQAEAREAIADRRRQELRDEGVDIPEDDDEEDDESFEGELDTDGDETPEEADEPEPDEDMVEIKVDGEVEKVKQSEVDAAGGVRALQKERAADKRLQEAARRARELERREAELAEREKGLQRPSEQETGSEAQQPPPARFDKQKLIELTNKIQYGDAEEAAEAMEEILSSANMGSAPQKVDTQQIAAQVRADIQGEKVLRRFAASPDDGGFGDLQDTRFASIPTTLDGKVYHLPAPLAVARQEVDRLIAEEKADPFAWETYEKAGNYAREQFGLQVKGNPTRRGQNSKLERKRNTDHPRGATPPAKAATDVDRSIDEQRRSAIQEMAEARGSGTA